MRFKIFIFILFFLSFFVFSNLYSQDKVLTWNDCLEYAKKNNYELLISQENIKRSESDVLIKKKNLATKLNFSMNANKNYANDEYTTNDNSSLNLSKVLFDNRTTYYGVKSLEQTVIGNKFSYEDTSSSVRLNLRLAFLNLFYAQEYLKLAEQIYDSRKNNYDLVKMNYESGLENKGSVLTAKSKLLSADYEIKKAKLNIEKMQNNLKYYLGGDIDLKNFKAKTTLNLIENMNEDPDFEKIILNTPSIKKLESEKQGKEYNLKLESLKISPELSFSASASQSDDTFFSDKDITHYLGLSLSFPIYQGNIRKEKIKQAKSDYDKLVLEIKNKHNEIFNNLKDNWIELNKSLFDLEVAKESLNAAKVRAEISKSKYSIGLVTFDDWIIIEDNYINAKKDLLLAQLETLNQEAKWIQSKGGNLNYDEAKN